MDVGFIGMGRMGRAMAANLARAGHTVRAWNRSPEAARGLDGVTPVASAAEAFAGDAVVTMLADDAAADAQALHERAIERWTHYLDLPAESFDEAWLIQTTLDRARAPVSVACAVSRSFHEALQQVARRPVQTRIAGLKRFRHDIPPSGMGGFIARLRVDLTTDHP